tara:strand:+ start:2521 stop:2895 length:375 start_codon:yes stop_codon:yes gene_type:complete
MAVTTKNKGVQREVKCGTFTYTVASSTGAVTTTTSLSLPAGAQPIAITAKVGTLCAQSINLTIGVGGQIITGNIVTNTHLNVAGEWVAIPLLTTAIPMSGGAVTVVNDGTIATGVFDFSICYIM